MMKILQHSAVIFISRLVLGFIFVLASIDKISMPELFAANVNAYQIVPFSLVNMFALIIPWLELICGIMLLAGFRLRASSMILSLLLIVFIVAILIAMARGLNIDCGCFSSSKATPVGWPKVIEDVGMLLLGLHIFFFSTRQADSLSQQAIA